MVEVGGRTLCRRSRATVAVAFAIAVIPQWSGFQQSLAQLGSAAALSDAVCTQGLASSYPCSNVDLLSFIPKATLGASTGGVNDVWGWTDPQSGREYALVGLSTGTAFVDVTDPVAPEFLGTLPAQTTSSSWRDIKVYGNHAVVVSEATHHGVQVFDLTQLRGVTVKPITFAATALYEGVGSAHNIFVNEDSGFAYAVGSFDRTGNCGPGLHIIDIRNPLQPSYAGCFLDTSTGRRNSGYTHDVQCVIYAGPDERYTGREVCFGSNETAISIADVTNKSAPTSITKVSYPIALAENSYIHQGWLTEDHRYFLQDDELDERNGFVTSTTTRIWDVSTLDAPTLLTTYSGPVGSIDHNLYVRGSWVYMANYASGLRIVDLSDIRNPREIAYFDTYPSSDGIGFIGAWSTYPFFASGSVLISSMGEGLFVVRPPLNKTGVGQESALVEEASVEVFPNPVRDVALAAIRVADVDDVRVSVYDMLGRVVLELGPVRLSPGAPHRATLDLSVLPAGRYIVRATGATTSASRLLTVVR